MKRFHYIPLCSILFLFCYMTSCGDSKRKAYEKAVIEWTGKKILFPDSMRLVGGGMISKPEADFTIVSYYDSVGCTKCNLRLSRWNEFMDKIDSYSPEEVSLIMISSPGKRAELTQIVRQYGFCHKFVIDEDNQFADLNEFPDNSYFRTFLLDSDGKVVIIGNPFDTPELGRMYFKHLGIDAAIFDEDLYIETFNFGRIEPFDTVRHRFMLTNNSADTLKIKSVETSCECTSARLSTYIVSPRTDYSLEVFFCDTVTGRFRRSVSLEFENNIPVSRFEISGEIH